MRAWQVQGAGEPAEVLHLVERELPEPGSGEVRIRVTAAGLGLPDVFMCRGTYPLTPPLPFTSGQEATGTVTAVGEGVDLSIGDQIMCVTSFIGGNGSFAEECLAVGRRRLPRARRSHRRRGGRVLDPAPHRVDRSRRPGPHRRRATGWPCSARPAAAGSPRCSSASALGARVIAIVSDDEQAAFCRDLGADATINHRDGPLAPRLRELTDGRGVDLRLRPRRWRARRGRRRRAGPPRASARGRLRQRRVAGRSRPTTS